MPPILRKRKVPDPSKFIVQRRKRVYAGFPSLDKCWEQSSEHRRYFLRMGNCKALRDYHEQQIACLPFDNLVARWATENLKTRFFTFYRVVGRTPVLQTYVGGIIDETDRRTLKKFSDLAIVKKLPEEVDNIPAPYNDWPVHFTFESVVMLGSVEERDEMRKAVEACMKRRLLFRNLCVKSCNMQIDTTSHDTFLLILNILRSRLILYEV